MSKRLPNVQKSVGVIKFIGRQHSHLTNITDHLNCHVFKLLLFISGLVIEFGIEKHKILSFAISGCQHSFLGNGSLWPHFWDDDFITLLSVSIHFATKWIFQRAINGAHRLWNILSNQCSNDYLHCQPVNQWGLKSFLFSLNCKTTLISNQSIDFMLLFL